MEVAVIGAGISGLACARELERLGHKPVIFEKHTKPGDIHSYASISLNLFNKGREDYIHRFRKEYLLNLYPLSAIHEIVFNSEKKHLRLRGNLGSIFYRGQGQDSLEAQLMNSVKAQIYTNQVVQVEQLKNDFDKIVVATGNHLAAEGMGCWKNAFDVTIRLARILGEFIPSNVTFWFNTKYFKNGHGYLIPLNEKSATLGMLIPRLSQEEDISNFMSEFLYSERLNYQIIETFEVVLNVGSAEPACLDKVYFIGNAGGFMEPIWGLGQEVAIESGIMAAQCIHTGDDFNKKTEFLKKDFQKNLGVCRTIVRFGNVDYDRFTRYFSFTPVKKYISRTHRNYLKAVPLIWNAPFLKKKQ